MAEIVILDRWRDRQARGPEIRIGEKPNDGSAQLLMFTGIRYERLDSVPGKSVPNAAMLFEQN